MKLSGSVISVPGEVGRQGRLVVRPNRERIRQILGTGSVLELQRQLLTSVMENEVKYPKKEIKDMFCKIQKQIIRLHSLTDFSTICHNPSPPLVQEEDRN